MTSKRVTKEEKQQRHQWAMKKIDQRDLLFQCVARLERTARKAEESGNYACVIGCVAQLNKMMALGADQKGFRGHSNHQYRRF